ncbi:hypothetical protein KIW84_023419 [Lathyrus oleraceus]|uniref:MULE transposase domain-containing protein n=1 Tax=Pisum sativum TaxID=3888 RepID=A0A9D4YCX2_PEA|nr:hypothetical protein KIW84_023419 [Pisum sativum]
MIAPARIVKDHKIKDSQRMDGEEDQYESDELGSSDPGASEDEKLPKNSDIIQDMRKNYSVGVTPSRAWEAKKISKEIIKGDAARQYAFIWRYAAELKRVCVGNTLKINVDRPNPSIQQRFGFFYFFFYGCKRGFTKGYRSFVGVDDYHLKTSYAGQLLIVVGMEPNDQYFSLTFGVVETKTKESWRWFLQLLMEDIKQDRRSVFISDQMKVCHYVL